MMIQSNTADLVDAIFNRELRPFPYSGRQMYGQDCVACIVAKGSNMDGLPKAGAIVDSMGLDWVVYWPHAEWTPGVQEYVDTLADPSGETE
jgi:hypothetical protein